MKKTFGSVTVLYSHGDGCGKEEILEEGFDILKEKGLQLVTYTKGDVKWLWGDFLARDADKEIARLAVKEIESELRDARVICWLYEWYDRYGELRASYSRIRPSRTNYALFFTIKSLLGNVNLKNTSFYECVMHLWKLKFQSLKNREGAKVREYMRSHPEVVEEVRQKQGKGER